MYSKRLAPMVLLFCALAQVAWAAPSILSAPVAGVSHSVVVIDSKKLKVPAAQALAAWPGAECVATSDTNGVVNCKGWTMSFNSWGVYDPGFTPVSSPDGKKLRVDGVKQKHASNIRQPGSCSTVGCVPPPAPPARPILITPSSGFVATEWGMTYRPDSELSAEPFISGFNVIVNGVDLGFVPSPVIGEAYLGFYDPDGIQSVYLYPVQAGLPPGDVLVGTFFAGYFWY